MNLLARQIARDRRRSGRRQVDLAGEGCSLSAVSAIETGRNIPTVATLDWLTDRLGRPPGHYYPLYIKVQHHPQALLELADRAMDVKRLDIAIRAAGRAVGLAASRRPCLHSLWVGGYVRIGRALFRRGQRARGSSVLERALLRALNSRAWLRAAEAAYVLGEVAADEGRWPEAQRLLVMAEHYLQVAEPTDPQLLLKVLRLLALTLRQMEFYDAAIPVYLQVSKLAQAQSAVDAVIAAEMGAGIAYGQKNEHRKSVDHLHRALDLFTRHAATLPRAVLPHPGDLHLALALAYQSLDRTAQRHHLRKALEAYEQDPSGEHEGYVLNETARGAFEDGDLEEALRVCQVALRKLEGPFHNRERALTHRLLGMIHRERGDLESAHDHLALSLKLLEHTPDRAGRARTLLELGRLYQRTQNLKQAMETLDLAAQELAAEGRVRLREVI